MKIKPNKNIYYYLYFTLLVMFSILVLLKVSFGIYLLFFLLGLGWSIFFFKNRLNILEHFLLSFVMLTVLFICFCMFFAFLDIKLTLIVGLVFFLISILVLMLTKTFNKENIKTKVEKWDYFILFLLFCSVFAKVYSVASFEVPGLHDPITHAYFTKQITDTGLINYFYSPGLHIISAFGKMFNGYDVAKQILYITNFFNAYIGVLVYIFIKHSFKKNIWAILSGILFCLGYYPAMFFVNAGKNSLVLAIVLLFLFFFLVGEYRRKKSIPILILANLAIMSIFLTHYPLGVFASTYLLAIFFVDFKKEKFRTMLLGIGILLGFAWMAKTYKYNLIAVAESAVVSNKALYSIPKDILNSITSFIKYIWNAQIYKNTIISKLIALFSFLGFIFICIKALRNRKFLILFLWSSFSFILALVLSLFSITPILIVLETYIISLFIYSYLFAGVFPEFVYKIVSKVINRKILNVCFVIFVIVIGFLLSKKMYKTFHERNSMHNVIEESDIKSFDWINQNIPDEEKFLINANGNDGLVFSTDGGGWLEVFTDNEISMPFYDYGSKKTDDNVDLYYDLKDDLGNCTYIKTFIDRGYKYYYQGSRPVFDRRLAEQQELIDSNRFKLLFDGGDSEVYELIPCE